MRSDGLMGINRKELMILNKDLIEYWIIEDDLDGEIPVDINQLIYWNIVN